MATKNNYLEIFYYIVLPNLTNNMGTKNKRNYKCNFLTPM